MSNRSSTSLDVAVYRERDRTPGEQTRTDTVSHSSGLLQSVTGTTPLGRYAARAGLAYPGWPQVALALFEGRATERRTVVLIRARGEMGAQRKPTATLTRETLLRRHIRHPNVIPVFDLLRARGELLLVMEYAAGETLSRLQSRGNRLPIPVSITLGIQVLNALHAGHFPNHGGPDSAVVHGSLSPDDVLVSADGSARLLDFGLTHSGTWSPSRRSAPPGYISPEQVFDEHVDARTDVFLAAVVIWESLTGCRLLEGDSSVDRMLRFLSSGARPPSQINPYVSHELDAVLARALESTPSRRFGSAAEFAEALSRVEQGAPAQEVSAYVEAVASATLAAQRAELLPGEPEASRSWPNQASSSAESAGAEQEDPTTRLAPELAAPLLGSHWQWRAPDEPTVVDGSAKPSVLPELCDAVGEMDHPQLSTQLPKAWLHTAPRFPVDRAPRSLSSRSRSSKLRRQLGLILLLGAAFALAFGASSWLSRASNLERVKLEVTTLLDRVMKTSVGSKLSSKPASRVTIASSVPARAAAQSATPAPPSRELRPNSTPVMRIDDLPLAEEKTELSTSKPRGEPKVRAMPRRNGAARPRRSPAKAAPAESPPASAAQTSNESGLE